MEIALIYNPSNTPSRADIGPSAKRHLNGVSPEGRCWSASHHYLLVSHLCNTEPTKAQLTFQSLSFGLDLFLKYGEHWLYYYFSLR